MLPVRLLPLRSKAAAAAITLLAIAAAFLIFCMPIRSRRLVLRNASDGTWYADYPVREGSWFSIGFIHSVNKSPVTDFYQIRDGAVYVEKTVYYGFGAGVQTEIGPGQTLSYGDDGSMIVTGFDQRMDDLTYFVGTVSDHVLTVDDGPEISLRELCGRNARVRFSCEEMWFWQ